jgi:hypothetical protein
VSREAAGCLLAQHSQELHSSFTLTQCVSCASRICKQALLYTCWLVLNARVVSALHVLTAASGQSVAVSCTKAEEQFWPASLTVTATSGAAADCSASDTDTVAITVLPKPDVSVTGPETEDVCSNATEVSFAYTVSSGQGSTTPLDLTVESTDATVTCTASSATQGKDGTAGLHMCGSLWLLTAST